MKQGPLVLTAAILFALGACKQADDDATAAQPAATQAGAAATPAPAAGTTPTETAPAAQTPPAELTAEEKARAEAQARLDYAAMEDGFLSDPGGQWATAAKASWADREAHAPDADPDAYGSPNWASGAPDGKDWNLTQNRPGFDWLEVAYDKPVSATEVRIAFSDGDGAQAISKIELIDTSGAAHSVWSGLSDIEDDDRGDRTWFVRKFEATPYQVQKVKITIANNVEDGYKHVDAVQLIGG